eukprot:TRINITY_DN7601_c0_g1_i1.p1 TRINITY_DN7601_c0_g1~~TRINITY_DN7601_c0_g1_i1.p1  ORF type:complete len:397 (+),score=61.69 TRINITY_DN7601_c0_g1_i1:561-1751(+)
MASWDDLGTDVHGEIFGSLFSSEENEVLLTSYWISSRSTCTQWKSAVEFKYFPFSRGFSRAVESGNGEMMEFMMQHLRPDKDIVPSFWDFYRASLLGHTRVLKSVLQYPPLDISWCNNWALNKTVHRNHKECVEMITNDPRFDAENLKEAFSEAINKNERFEIFEILMNKTGGSNLRTFHKLNIIRFGRMNHYILMRNMINLREYENLQFANIAVMKGWKELFFEIADYTQMNLQRSLCFRLAVTYNQYDMAQTLLERGAVSSESANFAFLTSCRNNKMEFVQLLLKFKREELEPKMLARCCYITARKGYMELFSQLYEMIQHDLSDRTVNYSFRKAAEGGHVKIMEMLLKHPKVEPSKAVYVRNKKRVVENCALTLAKENRRMDVVDMLLSYQSR